MNNTGGPAFPVDFSTTYKGMTLRDYFAVKAMQAQLGMTETLIAFSEKTISIDQLCGSCYEWADAMLKAREK